MTMSRETFVRLHCLDVRINDADARDGVRGGHLHKDPDPEGEEIRLLKERLRLLEDDVRWLLRAFERRR